MDLDAPVCLCFRVSRRKLLQYLRLERPRVASQLSECDGAGTGCGWCIPYLKKLFTDPAALDFVEEAEYIAGRVRHRTPTTTMPPTAASRTMTDTIRTDINTWLMDFAANPDVTTVNLAIGEVIASEPENVSVRAATLGLAAGEVVAALAGSPSESLPAGVLQWANANAKLSTDLVIQARIALDRVQAGAEVAALGNTPSVDVASCQDAATELLTRLG